ncbi:hypothetical protein PM082_005246 [Marasmius tenuissimus]|nr:hypothetical protein PM082_005246 [Marasmius tenuissimus]
MAPSRLLNLLALTAVAILASTYGAEPVNALSGHGPLNGKAHDALISRGHGSMMKKKRTQQKRCKAREQNGDNGSTYSGNDNNNNTTTAEVITTEATPTEAIIALRMEMPTEVTAIPMATMVEIRAEHRPAEEMPMAAARFA